MELSKYLVKTRQVIEDYPTSGEAIIQAGLNYTVQKRPLFTLNFRDLAQFRNPDAVH